MAAARGLPDGLAGARALGVAPGGAGLLLAGGWEALEGVPHEKWLYIS